MFMYVNGQSLRKELTIPYKREIFVIFVTESPQNKKLDSRLL